MFSIGKKLKCAREEQGLDLSVVSTRTKITLNYLEAIEADDRKKMPSGFFYRSFVEQYARLLSLDTREINAELDRVLAADAPLPLPGQDGNPIRRVAPLRVRRRIPWVRTLGSIASLALVVLGCAAIYSWWHDGRLPIDLPALLRGSIASPRVVEAAKEQEVARPAAGGEAQHSEPDAVAPATEKVIERPAVNKTPAVNETPAVHETPAIETPASETPVREAPARTTSSRATRSKLLLNLVAREKTWLSVSSDGKPVFSGVLAARQSKTIAGKQSARLRVGNAAGLVVRLNGKLLGRLGARGQVLEVVFTPDNFEIVQRAKDGD